MIDLVTDFTMVTMVAKGRQHSRSWEKYIHINIAIMTSLSKKKFFLRIIHLSGEINDHLRKASSLICKLYFLYFILLLLTIIIYVY